MIRVDRAVCVSAECAPIQIYWHVISRYVNGERWIDIWYKESISAWPKTNHLNEPFEVIFHPLGMIRGTQYAIIRQVGMQLLSLLRFLCGTQVSCVGTLSFLDTEIHRRKSLKVDSSTTLMCICIVNSCSSVVPNCSNYCFRLWPLKIGVKMDQL